MNPLPYRIVGYYDADDVLAEEQALLDVDFVRAMRRVFGEAGECLLPTALNELESQALRMLQGIRE